MAPPKAHPFSIRMFLPDGTPEGLRIIEKSNWTGCGVYVPRTVLPSAKQRDEFARTGVYVLVGQSDDQALPTIYIGQGDVVRSRLLEHYATRDFWTWVIFFVSKDEGLNRAHVQHLEARLIELARDAKRANLENSAVPQRPHLSEADRADMESFLDDVLSILPLVGLTAFEKPRATHGKRSRLFLAAKGVQATGYESAEGFVVREGSQAVTRTVPSIPKNAATLRADLMQQGVLVTDGQTLLFTQDYAFTSPSTASDVVLGSSTNGRTEWKDAHGRTLKELQSTTPAPADAEGGG